MGASLEASPFFTLKHLSSLGEQVQEASEEGSNSTTLAGEGQSDRDDDSDISISVGPRTVQISPDQLDSKDNGIRHRVGWSTIGDTLSSGGGDEAGAHAAEVTSTLPRRPHRVMQ